jgi:hypothetical protein
VTKRRTSDLVKRTRAQICAAIEDDLTNSESLMKEVFEECTEDGELEVVYAEMRACIGRIKRAA